MSPEHGTRYRYVSGCRCADCTAANRDYARRRDVYGWSERVAADWADAAPAREHIAALQAKGMGYKRVAEVAGLSVSTLHAIIWGKHGYPAKRILRRNLDAILAVEFDPAGSAVIDPTGTVRRIRALQAMGWPLREIGARCDIATQNLGTIASSGRGVYASTATRIAKVYDELSMTPGPSSRSRVIARKRGWQPPLAWDDLMIDDPHCQVETDFYNLENVPDLTSGEDLIDEVAVERFITGDLNWRNLSAPERLEAAVRMDRAGTSRNEIAARTHLNTRTLWSHLRARNPSESEGTIAS